MEQQNTWHLRLLWAKAMTRLLIGGVLAFFCTKCSPGRFKPLSLSLSFSPIEARWSTMLMLSSGLFIYLQPPFTGGNRHKIQQKIIKDKLKLPTFLSSEAHSLLKGVNSLDFQLIYALAFNSGFEFFQFTFVLKSNCLILIAIICVFFCGYSCCRRIRVNA